MTGGIGTLLTLAGYFALLSLFAIGGANAALPEMHRLAVDVMHWMSERQFADMFAIAQVTPGPNVIVVALIGYHHTASSRTTHEIAQDLIYRNPWPSSTLRNTACGGVRRH